MSNRTGDNICWCIEKGIGFLMDTILGKQEPPKPQPQEEKRELEEFEIERRVPKWATALE